MLTLEAVEREREFRMLLTEIRILAVAVLGFLFAHLYRFIEHGYIPPAEHWRLRFFNHFAN